jgi:hypothetical protein
MLLKTTLELKRLLGFIYASLEFDNLKTDLKLASSDMRRLIGSAMYDAALDFYNRYQAEYAQWPDDPPATPYQKAMSELVMMIQLPVALNAYQAYSRNADLTHSDKGRQISVTENDKPAFEWQINRDEEAMRNRAAKATEELLRWLEEHTQEVITLEAPVGLIPGNYYTDGAKTYLALKAAQYGEEYTPGHVLQHRIVAQVHVAETTPQWDPEASYNPGDVVQLPDNNQGYVALTTSQNLSPNASDTDWGLAVINPALITRYKASPEWQRNNTMVVNHLELFEKAFPLEGSFRLFRSLTPFIRESERRTISAIVGAEKLKALLERRRRNILTEEDQELIDFIIPVVAISTMAMAVRRLSVTLLPDGLLKQYVESGNTARGSATPVQRTQVAKTLDDATRTEVAALQMYLQRQSTETTNTSWTPTSILPQNEATNLYFST